jgi:hypothetical protein
MTVLNYCSHAKVKNIFFTAVIPGNPLSFGLAKVGIRWNSIGTRKVGISRENL